VRPGRAVARLTDLGWGQRLRELVTGGIPDGPASEPLIRACVDVLAGWGWEQRPAGVVAMPSRRRPELVTSVARSIGEIGRLPYLGALTCARGGPIGSAGGNSAFRLAGLWERLAVSEELRAGLRSLGGAPVLLVDDVADTRWTLTVAGRALRQAGAGDVLPFVLALAG
jgi:ATP-dependent DNA helicase RecQ